MVPWNGGISANREYGLSVHHRGTVPAPVKYLTEGERDWQAKAKKSRRSNKTPRQTYVGTCGSVASILRDKNTTQCLARNSQVADKQVQNID